MEKLKPCPFCGRTPVVVQIEPCLHRRLTDKRLYTVCCPSCNLLFGWDTDYGGEFKTEDEAIAAWNQRCKEVK